jgi:hypothetical protein
MRMNRFGDDVEQFRRLYHATIQQALQGLRPESGR